MKSDPAPFTPEDISLLYKILEEVMSEMNETYSYGINDPDKEYAIALCAMTALLAKVGSHLPKPEPQPENPNPAF